MLIFLHGPDTFRSKRKLKEIKDKFINQIDKSALNIETLDGQGLEPVEFEKAIFSQPFLAKKRMIIVENFMAKNKGQKLQKEILEILDKGELENSIVVFWEGELNQAKTKSKSKLSASRSKLLADRLKQEKYAQEFKLLAPAEVKHFVIQEVKARGAKISPQGAQLLADFVGNDLWQINSEIDKLIAFSQAKEITAEQIENLVKTKLDDDIFKLTDALGQKNKQLALKLITDQLQSGTAPTELLARITWQFKNLLLVKSFVDENGTGYGDSRLTYQLGLHPFVIKKTFAQIKNYSLSDLKKTYQRLLSIDYKLKTSQVDPEVLFDLLVVRS